MILFVFEGVKTEPRIFKTIETLFLNGDNIVCSYCSNIYSLYEKLAAENYFDNDKNSLSIIPLLQEEVRKHPENTDKDFLNLKHIDEISEIYLFFDYDCNYSRKYESLKLEDNNKKIGKLLNFFDDETSVGKLYINYPMVESFRYTKKLPDKEFYKYKIMISQSRDVFFKKTVDEFSYYKNYDFAILRKTQNTVLSKEIVRKNWLYLIFQNMQKAFYIFEGKVVSIQDFRLFSESELFSAELKNYVQKEETIAILNAFPIFIFEYVHEPIIKELENLFGCISKN